MHTQQISVFVENKPGRLYKLTDVFGKHGIDLIALCIADTTDFGILRCIVNDPSKALEVLKENGYAASTTSVLAVEVPDQPGGLANVLKYLDEKHIAVEYLYSFVRTNTDGALILFKVEDVDTAESILKENDVNVLTDREVYSIKN